MKPTVMGVHAPSPRLTVAGLCIIASAIALPVAILLWVADWLWL